MLTVGVEGGTGELRPIRAHAGFVTHTECTVNELLYPAQPEKIITGLSLTRGVARGPLDV